MNKYAWNSGQVAAQYSEPAQTLYKGNPAIEALPEIPSFYELVDQMTYFPPYDESERQIVSHKRQNFPPLIHTCFQPWSVHIDFARKLYNAILLGYESRNPLSAKHTADLSVLHDCVVAKDPCFSTAKLSNAISCGFSVIGSSGTGKTSAAIRGLAMYPETILHEEYKGMPFHHLQIVWMRLECPIDGSIKGLCSSFFTKFDGLTGDKTYEKFVLKGRGSTDQLIPQMALIARRHSLGVLVIDEIQNILAAKTGGIDRMLNFISNLVNTIGVPIVLIGTPKAISFLSRDLMNARRSTGMGAVIMDTLRKDSDDWLTFMESIWKFQWTNISTPLNPKIIEIMHDLSGGVVDTAVNIYIAAQIKAIKAGEVGGSEKITISTLKSAAYSDSFAMLQPKIEMINNPKPSDLTDADAKMYWDKGRGKHVTPAITKAKEITADQIRQDVLQESVSIPQLTNDSIPKYEKLTMQSLEDENLIFGKD